VALDQAGRLPPGRMVPRPGVTRFGRVRRTSALAGEDDRCAGDPGDSGGTDLAAWRSGSPGPVATVEAQTVPPGAIEQLDRPIGNRVDGGDRLGARALGRGAAGGVRGVATGILCWRRSLRRCAGRVT